MKHFHPARRILAFLGLWYVLVNVTDVYRYAKETWLTPANEKKLADWISKEIVETL